MIGYSRDSFYRFKELYDKGGELALQVAGDQPQETGVEEVPQDVEDAIVAAVIFCWVVMCPPIAEAGRAQPRHSASRLGSPWGPGHHLPD